MMTKTEGLLNPALPEPSIQNGRMLTSDQWQTVEQCDDCDPEPGSCTCMIARSSGLAVRNAFQRKAS